ncbi:MAG: hemolysin III family protein [Alphaproteobacteria bacterium]|nr:hemolysin III family protein [Alphaproteobacteria bacterium]
MSVESDDRNEHRFPSYSRGEVWADTAAHVLGLLFGLIATVALLVTASQHDQMLLILGASLYGLGLLTMLTCSAAYNLWPPSPTKELWRRFDHAAIFIMIAGTYTPFLLNRVGGDWGVGLLSFVWSVAIIGAILKLTFPRRWESITIGLYLGLGWSILIAINPLVQSISMDSLILIGAGGVIYSIGVVFHLWDRLPYQNAIWHWLVLAAAVCHYVAIFNEVAIAGG